LFVDASCFISLFLNYSWLSSFLLLSRRLDFPAAEKEDCEPFSP
jgi:hypothetical protein